jgi:hypothetical protein
VDFTAAVAGLVGALVGAFTSIATIVIQGRLQTRREGARLLFETAFHDYELRIDRYGQDGAPLPAPFFVILAYHQKMMALADRGQLTPAKVGEILAAQTEMIEGLSSVTRAQDGTER